MTRKELLKDSTYWTAELQMELYRQIEAYMEKHKMNRTQLSDHLKCSKGYVSQLLSGDFDHKLSKFFELSLAIDKIPKITFVDVDDYIKLDKGDFKQSLTVSVNDSNSFSTFRAYKGVGKECLKVA